MNRPVLPRNSTDANQVRHAKLAVRVVLVMAAAAWPPKGGRPDSTRLRARAIRAADRVHGIDERVAVVFAPPARPPEGRRAGFAGEGARATRSVAYTRAD
jgi:hypothetical protein